MRDEMSTDAARGRPIARRVVTVGVGALAIVATVAACSLPVDERVTPIDRGQFGEQLTQDTTTTTSVLPTSTTPTTISDDAAEPTTTTVAPIPTEPVKVYYSRGATDVMQEVTFELALDTPIDEVVVLLETRTGLADAGLRTAVRPGLIAERPVVDRAVATVVLDGDVVDRMPNDELERAIAQIVLTLTSFRTPDASNIGAVRFEVDGAGFPVFVPAFGGSSDPGEAVVFIDFASLIATTPSATTTTTTEEPTPVSDPAT